MDVILHEDLGRHDGGFVGLSKLVIVYEDRESRI
jgi:hypothetical protein